MSPLLNIVYEDADLLVVNKPAGLVCHPTKGGVYSSLISRVRLFVGEDIQPQLINRLDRETSGLTLVAKIPECARELRLIWEKREVLKTYLGIVHGHMAADEGTIDAPLGRDAASAVAIKDCVRPDGLLSSTSYRVLNRFSRSAQPYSLLKIEPRTGRKHQIRIHLAHIGHSLVGDKLYGGDENLYLDFVQFRLTDAQRERLLLPNQALHAGEVEFQWRGQEWHFTAPPEDWFLQFAGAEAHGSSAPP
ncbi:MAG TPA: RluA family pseudouridine synthase [Verrucomicrobiae bacterium]|jgi:23S rRNA pseudouridine1911/1915/1917 synthase